MKKYKTRPYEEMRAEIMADPVFKKRWDARANQRRVTRNLIEARIKHKLTQRQLAERIGIKQPSLARIERGTYLPSIATLQKIATGLGKKLEIRFV